MRHHEHLIIGAGAAGLTLGRILSQNSKSVLVLEKSRGLGGRMATRWTDSAKFDHGAQFVKTPGEFHSAWKEFFTPNHSHLWFQKENFQYYSFKNGMTSWAKWAAQGLDIQLNQKVVRLTQTNSDWLVQTEEGPTYSAANIYLSAPLPQALDLLKASNFSHPVELERIQYAKALVALLELKESKMMDFDFLENINSDIYSAANQSSKGLSPNPAVTLVMTPEYSEKNYNRADEVNLKDMLSLISKSLNWADSCITSAQLKKWRYSHPLNTYPESFCQISTQPSLILFGDAFGGGSLNGAVRSALQVRSL
jgi:predicted NAD/FAD-dependent oxidoreductase